MKKDNMTDEPNYLETRIKKQVLNVMKDPINSFL